VVRYNTDGSLDSTFGTGGIVTTAIGTATNQGWGEALQSNSEIVVAGFAANGSKYNFTVTRYLGDSASSPGIPISGLPSTTTSEVVNTIPFAADDGSNKRNVNYTGTVHLRSSDPTSKLGQDYTFMAADNSIGSFSAAFNTVGTEWLTAADSLDPNITGIETGVVVSRKK